MVSLEQLDKNIDERIRDFPISLSSRIHPLQNFGGRIHVKRDDELSCGISGSKLRKIASLLPQWQARQPVVAVGSASSNHLIACLQIFNEYQIDYQIWIKETHDSQEQGNENYLRLLAEPSRIIRIAQQDWSRVDELAINHMKEGKCAYVMKEGGCQEDAVWGAMTLGRDILKHSTSYQHIFVDAGTGLSAVALQLYLDAARWRGCLHIIAMAPVDFQDLYERMGRLTGVEPFVNCRIHAPVTAKSFGSFNRACADELTRVAREEGVLFDPLYGAKLSLTVRKLIAEFPTEASLMVHSGGVLSLGGFWRLLQGSF